MNAAIGMIMAMLFVAAIPSGTSGATGEYAIPYIEIEYPEDGSTVGTEEILVVVAEGRNLQSPSFSVEGEQVGYAGPLTGCVFEIPEVPVTGELGGTTMRMYCEHKLNLNSFEEQKVKVSVSVYEQSGILTDSVGLYVSGHRA